jgi:hypothetical protein
MFRKISKKIIEPLTMVLIIIGIVALCQPWVLILHRKGFLITGAGLALYIFFSHIKPLDEEEDEEEVEAGIM